MRPTRVFELTKLGGYVLAPLTLTLGLWIAAGACFALRRRRWALGLACLGFALLWAASTPALARAIAGVLEERYPALSVEATPTADAIVLLGGALVAPDPPRRPHFQLGPAAGRVWHAAALFRAGKAKWIVVVGGNQPGSETLQPEGDVIAGMLAELGVPPAAIRRETRSRNTRENAANVLAELRTIGAQKVLLVTSAQHMPRAVKTFQKVWAGAGPELIPASTDVNANSITDDWKLWLPSLESLLYVTKGVKEFAGWIALAMI